MDYSFEEMVDLEVLKKLFQSFTRINGFAAAVLDLKGNVLVASGWRDICTKFHRVHPAAAARCTESDTILAGKLNQGEQYNVYRCKNGLVDVAVPIVIKRVHVGNLFTGQFFFRPPDLEFFRRQAIEFGFDEHSYLEALSRVPVCSEEQVRQVMDYLCQMAVIIGEIGLNRIGLIEVNQSLTQEINERKLAEEQRGRLEAELRQAQKMEAVGTLAGGIAHDFNNLLQAINGYTQFLLLDKTKGDPGYFELETIRGAGERAAQLVQQLLMFSRKLESQKRPIDLNQLIEHVKSLLERTLPKMIQIELAIEADLRFVNADPAQMEQVLLNLAANARDAMPDGGKLTITTANTTLNQDCGPVFSGDKNREGVLLSVADSGTGMAGEVIDQIFEPFFTTKDIGKGTGLGLASVYGIVQSHGGQILCSSVPGQGTTFKIYLSAVDSVDSPLEMVLGDGSLPAGHETILVTEDEEWVREMVRQMLERFGYRVILANNGEQALEIHQELKNDIDLVILDLNMPGMGGHKCLSQLLKRDPNLKVIVASGYSSEGMGIKVMEEGAAAFLGKPYRLSDMLTIIRQVMDGLPGPDLVIC